MAEFIEIIKKDPNIQNEKSQTLDKYNKESFSTRSQTGRNPLIQSRIFEKAVNFMGGTIELKRKDNKYKFKKLKKEWQILKLLKK